MNGIIGKKIGMTSIFDDKGKNVPCTIIETSPNVVTHMKSEATDGYEACLLYTSPSPRDATLSRMPSSA